MGVSVFTALLPVILIIFSSLYTIVCFPSESLIKKIVFLLATCYRNAYFRFSGNIYTRDI